MKCQHTNCQFIGYASIKGNYICQDCGLKIDPLIFHFINEEPHIWLQPVGAFSNIDENMKCVQYCLTQYWGLHGNSYYYQPPHWDHEPTEEELKYEEKLVEQCDNNCWLREQYAKIISFVLGATCES
jgi:hypothetical protein